MKKHIDYIEESLNISMCSIKSKTDFFLSWGPTTRSHILFEKYVFDFRFSKNLVFLVICNQQIRYFSFSFKGMEIVVCLYRIFKNKLGVKKTHSQK